MFRLLRSQAQTITFVMVDAAYTEVAGLGGTFTLQISKNGGAFNPSTGAKAEMSNGWYSYVLSAAETDTVGPLSIRVTGAGCLQQNLEYVVIQRNAGAIEFTYTLTNTVTLLPIAGAEVWVTTDVAGLNVVWNGDTDNFGVARDDDGYLPWLDAGTYYFWSKKAGFTFPNPDTEIVS
jgi:hypothetical protein